MLDNVLNKIAGKSAQCKSGTAITLPKTCVPDSMNNLLMARLF